MTRDWISHSNTEAAGIHQLGTALVLPTCEAHFLES